MEKLRYSCADNTHLESETWVPLVLFPRSCEQVILSRSPLSLSINWAKILILQGYCEDYMTLNKMMAVEMPTMTDTNVLLKNGVAPLCMVRGVTRECNKRNERCGRISSC